jgi:hypothetical protein
MRNRAAIFCSKAITIFSVSFYAEKGLGEKSQPPKYLDVVI